MRFALTFGPVALVTALITGGIAAAQTPAPAPAPPPPVAATPTTPPQTAAAPAKIKRHGGYYSQCADFNIADVDRGGLTHAEYIAQKDQALFDALAENAECMSDAFETGQQRQAAAGGGAGGANNNGDGERGGEEGENTDGQQNNGQTGAQGDQQGEAPQKDADGQYMPPAAKPDRKKAKGRGAGNQAVTGKSTEPCELYRELKAEATSKEERDFYLSEMKKYC